MRVPTDIPQRRQRGSNRGRILLIVGLVVFFLLMTSLRGIAGFWTDFLWYDSLGLSDVFSGILGAQLTLVAAFTGAFFLLLFVNLTIGDRIAPKFHPAGPDELMLARYQELMARRAFWVRAGVSLFLAILFGASAGAEWNSWVLFSHRQTFGTTDPEFGRDIGFYVFELPFYSFVVEWLFVSLVIVILIVAAAHYLNGGIRLQSPFQRVTPQVKTHLSVLLAAAALVKAIDYWLQRFELVFSQRGFVDGAGYADLEAKLPALDLMILISLAACVLFVANIWRRGWTLPGVAVGLWVFAAIVASTAYPAVIQRFVVEPEESAREQPYIARNIEATREAVGLGADRVEVREFAYSEELDASALRANGETIRNLRILDPEVVDDTVQRLESGRTFYQFADLDVDRYPITNAAGDAQTTQVIVGTRELNVAGIQSPSWESQHAAYTHGYGMVLAPSNSTNSSGEPEFLVGDMPVDRDPDVAIDLERPEIYVGEGLGGYSIVGTERTEIDYVTDSGEQVTTSYAGEGGVDASGTGIGGFARRAAFALRFGEIEPLISNFITADSRVIYVRDVRERVQKVAPFFQYDADPYPVVVDGRISYVVDGYATTSFYPYAQQVDTSQIDSGSGLSGHAFNYVRNSVKAVVDAYDGSVTLYVMDGEDPITQAYVEAFPSLFATYEEMPEELRAHLRYPDDLFIAQTTMWGRYHVDDPATFYDESESWEVAQAPAAGTVEPGQSQTRATTLDAQGEPVVQREERIPPYYQQMQLPGEDEASFLSMRSFVRSSTEDQQKLLTSFMVAGSDPGNYGQLTVYELDQGIDGPGLVASKMVQDEDVADVRRPLESAGTQIVFGNLIMVPIDDALLYVRPMYTKAAGDTPVPQLNSVILALGAGDDVVIDSSLEGALAELFRNDDGIEPQALAAIEAIFDEPILDPGEPGGPDEPEEPGEPPVAATAEELLAEADALFAEADEILANLEGLEDLAAYEAKIDEARAKVEEAYALLGGVVDDPAVGDDTTTTTAPPTTAPPDDP
jgi:uncharacterized membrane protein (UPF0182 family)